MKWLPKILGLIVVLLAIAGGWYWQSVSQKLDQITAIEEAREPATASGYVGGEKISLLKDPLAVQILQQDGSNLTVASEKSGSMDMVRSPAPGKDFLWPSNQVAVEFFKGVGGQPVAVEDVFGSPVVIYAYADVTAGLVAAGIVTEEQGVAYVDMPKLTALLSEEKTWKDIGLPQFYGKVRVISTDPVASSSGNMFAGLLASMMNGGEVPDTGTVDAVLPPLSQYFKRLGLLEGSSGTLFEKFLNDKGGHPAIVGYENQLVEFNLENPQYQQLLKTSVRTLYPRPTTWASHPMIALTPNGKRLIEAMKRPDMQKLAWERHGFRSGLNAQNDPQALQVAGIPANVTAIIPMPSASVMEKIVASLSSN